MAMDDEEVHARHTDYKRGWIQAATHESELGTPEPQHKSDYIRGRDDGAEAFSGAMKK